MSWLSYFFRPSSQRNSDKFVTSMPDEPLNPMPGLANTDTFSIAQWLTKLQITENDHHWSDLEAVSVVRIDHVRMREAELKKHALDKVAHEAIAFEYCFTTTEAGKTKSFNRAAFIHRRLFTTALPIVREANLLSKRDSDAKDEVRVNQTYKDLGVATSGSNFLGLRSSAKYRSARSLLCAAPNPSQRRITALDMAILCQVVSKMGIKYNIKHNCMWYATMVYLAVQRLAGASLQQNPDADTDVLGYACPNVRLVDPITGHLLFGSNKAEFRAMQAQLYQDMAQAPVENRGTKERMEEMDNYAADLNCNARNAETSAAVPENVLEIAIAKFELLREEVRKTIIARMERIRGRVGEVEREREAEKCRAEAEKRRADAAEAANGKLAAKVKEMERRGEEERAERGAFEARMERQLEQERAARERERQEERAAQERGREEGLARQTALEAQMAQMALLLNRLLPPEPTRVDRAPSTGVAH
ncbi:hypothetical protein MKEN_00357800 [Mycena kentingensis (nom. inval.)]|nr:hypothetical protein MKEN_00357800 [Mycena kentingensis (nom. inval.)]